MGQTATLREEELRENAAVYGENATAREWVRLAISGRSMGFFRFLDHRAVLRNESQALELDARAIVESASGSTSDRAR